MWPLILQKKCCGPFNNPCDQDHLSAKIASSTCSCPCLVFGRQVKHGQLCQPCHNLKQRATYQCGKDGFLFLSWARGKSVSINHGIYFLLLFKKLCRIFSLPTEPNDHARGERCHVDVGGRKMDFVVQPGTRFPVLLPFGCYRHRSPN